MNDLLSTLFKNFSWPSFILGLLPLALYWFNSLLTFKKETIQELKNIAKELVDTWTSMKESTIKIMNYAHWIRQYKDSDNSFYSEKIPGWHEGIYNEKNNLTVQYNKSTRLIGYLYFYYDGYLLQNKLDSLFESMKDTDWDKLSYSRAWRDLHVQQDKGVELLGEIKKQIDALSTLRPRPIHNLLTFIHFIDLQTYRHRRHLRVMFKRTVKQKQCFFYRPKG